MGQFKDLVVTGATRLLGKITTKDVEINGGLVINSGSKNNFNEGIRINRSNAGWSTLVLGADPGSTSGTGTGIWSMCTYEGNFYLSHIKSDGGSPRIEGNKNGSWSIYGRTVFTNRIDLPVNTNSILFREYTNDGGTCFDTWMTYETSGDEALVFGTTYSNTSFIFANNISRSNISHDQWQSITPGLQIKNNCVSIGELIANNVTPSYKLNVNGAVRFTNSLTFSCNNYTGYIHASNASGKCRYQLFTASTDGTAADVKLYVAKNNDTTGYSIYTFGKDGNLTVPGDVYVTIDGKLESLKTYVSNGKTAVSGAIAGMGVSPSTSSDTFDTMAANIKKITPTLSGSWSALTFSYNATNNGNNKVTASTSLTHDNTGSGSWSTSEPQTYSWSATSKVKHNTTVLSTKTTSGSVSLTVNAGGTIIPSTSEQSIISSGSRLYFSGDLKVASVGGNATADCVLSGKTFSSNSAGRAVAGSMTNNGARYALLNCGNSYTIPAGYHNGSGMVTAASLSSQTSATATAAHILSGYTAWVNGSKITGTMKEAFPYNHTGIRIGLPLSGNFKLTTYGYMPNTTNSSNIFVNATSEGVWVYNKDQAFTGSNNGTNTVVGQFYANTQNYSGAGSHPPKLGIRFDGARITSNGTFKIVISMYVSTSSTTYTPKFVVGLCTNNKNISHPTSSTDDYMTWQYHTDKKTYSDITGSGSYQYFECDFNVTSVTTSNTSTYLYPTLLLLGSHGIIVYGCTVWKII